MTCGDGMTVVFEQGRQEKIEVMQWIAGTGPQTPAVWAAIQRYGVTFGIALITRERFAADGCVDRN